jgi:Asp-tRNA(Asn)/Glu-tRNA(Gln) amidotransferase A subunit family amidase
VAAGFCDLGLGTQTIGSIVRPAAFCGVVGLKPTFGRVATGGVIPLAPSLDHVGCLATDVATVSRAAQVLCAEWDERVPQRRAPVLGIPQGPYLDRIAGDTRAWFEGVCAALAASGCEVRPTAVMADFEDVRERHHVILAAEAARTHAAWFDEYEELYGEQMRDLVRRGRLITERQLQSALDGQAAFRRELSRQMIDSRLDAWICPSTIGPAPEGLATTGDPVMNLPWTQAGLPVINLPAGLHRSGLPMGVQIVGAWRGDESLLVHAEALQRVTSQL